MGSSSIFPSGPDTNHAVLLADATSTSEKPVEAAGTTPAKDPQHVVDEALDLVRFARVTRCKSIISYHIISRRGRL